MELVHQLNDSQIIELHGMYQGEWWSKSRTLEETEICVRNSSVIFAAISDGSLIGFARILTDTIFKALIFDVIVHPSKRGTSCGAFLMDSILHHDALGRVKHFELYCQSDLRPFYSRWGFSPNTGDVTLMRLVRGYNT